MEKLENMRQHLIQAVLSSGDDWIEQFRAQLPISRVSSLAPSDAENRRRLRDELDCVSAALDSLKLSVMRRRNSLNPAGRLYPDILSQIFECHAEIQSPFEDWYRHPRALPYQRIGWVVDTHVCHQWRQVAISDAKLWRSIPFVLGQEWTDVFVSRAQRSGMIMRYYSPPLKKLLQPPDGYSPISPSTFYDSLHLTSHLHLQGASGEVSCVASILNTPAPMLKTFIVDAAGLERNFPMTLPPKLLAGHAPNLLVLKLDGVHIPWDSQILRNLVEFSVCNLDGQDRRRIRDGGLYFDEDPSAVWTYVPDSNLVPSRDRLLDVLRACPHLRKLSLRGCLPSSYDTRIDTPPVPLQHLEHLDLYGSLGGIESIYKHCEFPLSCPLSVAARLSISDLPRITSVLHPLASAAHAYLLRALYIALDDPVEIRAWRTLPVASWGNTDFETHPDIRIVLDLRRDGIAMAPEYVMKMVGVCNLLTPNAMSVVAVQSRSPRELPLLNNLFCALTAKMEHLHVDRETCEAMFLVDTEALAGTDVPSPNSVLHLDLKTLWISEVKFHAKSRRTELSFAEQLQLWLIRRFEAGIKLETIVLDRCGGVSSKLLKNLKRVVVRVGVRWTDSGDPKAC
ncbi:hypothetical protein BC834DRAFT_971297 [Gloeopeniophorella convolvens]|nr:hypothetical protein BC834DRAFT_971297 [Gloeopeniophorella convolvens]